MTKRLSPLDSSDGQALGRRATPKSAKFPQAQRNGGEGSQGAGEKNRSTSLFPLIIGQSVSLDARFGDQIASPMHWLSQIAHPRCVAKVAAAGWKSREEETN